MDVVSTAISQQNILKALFTYFFLTPYFMTKAQIILTSSLFSFSIFFISLHYQCLSSNPLSFLCSPIFRSRCFPLSLILSHLAPGPPRASLVEQVFPCTAQPKFYSLPIQIWVFHFNSRKTDYYKCQWFCFQKCLFDYDFLTHSAFPIIRGTP